VMIAAVCSLSINAAPMQVTPAKTLQATSNVFRPIPSITKYVN
jgi:hypothetical protein